MFNMTADEQRVVCRGHQPLDARGKAPDVLIGKRFPLAETAAAHQLQEDNTLRKAGTLTGKIVILSNRLTVCRVETPNYRMGVACRLDRRRCSPR